VSESDTPLPLVNGPPDCTRDTIWTFVNGGEGGSSKRTMLDKGGGPKSHFLCRTSLMDDPYYNRCLSGLAKFGQTHIGELL